jgi:hypothetical protein
VARHVESTSSNKLLTARIAQFLIFVRRGSHSDYVYVVMWRTSIWPPGPFVNGGASVLSSVSPIVRITCSKDGFMWRTGEFKKRPLLHHIVGGREVS